MLSVPFAIVDATTLTEAGYVGEDVENIILKLLQNAGGDKEKCQQGIVYIDEIDKIARRGRKPVYHSRRFGRGRAAGAAEDSGRNGRQRSAAGWRKHPHQEFIQIDTTNILFICGGAFVGLEKIIERRVGKKSMGFLIGDKAAKVLKGPKKDQPANILEACEPRDLIKYGLIPEFVEDCRSSVPFRNWTRPL